MELGTAVKPQTRFLQRRVYKHLCGCLQTVCSNQCVIVVNRALVHVVTAAAQHWTAVEEESQRSQM